MPYLGNEGRESLATSFHMDMTFLSVKKRKKCAFFKSRKGHVETEVLTIFRDYFCTGFFFRVDILYMYSKGNLNLIYLISYNNGFWNNKSSSSWLPW